MKYSKVLKSGSVFINSRFQELNIGINGNRIEKISASPLEGTEVVSCKGLSIFPGFIDSQVHFREPGLTHKECIKTGSMAAAAGGITAFFEMPNTKPASTDKQKLLDKIEIAKRDSYTDFAFFAGATKANIEDLETLRKIPGVCGIKIFMGSSTGDLLVSKDAELEQILRKVRSPIAVHSEDEDLLIQRKAQLDLNGQVQRHPLWRNEEVALSSTHRILRLAQKTGKKVHILHITSKEEVEYLLRQKNYCSFEITPQHLSFFAPDIYNQLSTKAQMNPPIRAKHHQEALWKAVNTGLVDVFGSDHAPHTLEEKSKSYPESPSGMPGVETMAPVLLTHALNGKFELSRCVKMLSENVAKLYSLKELGSIEEGKLAHLSIFNLKAKYKIDESKLHSRCGWSPFHGFESRAQLMMTMVGGDFVYRDQSLIKTRRNALHFSHNHS